ncbi:MAG: hypothetical protein ACD_26C00034G0107 [uncultured bacterium]|nr:MAG: hypothetical protein ACD_26C00034G0107 [uncultured bacterium]
MLHKHQNADIYSSTIANSKSGNIKTTGNGDAITGNSFSIANDFSLTNYVGIGGSFIFGILNILGDWKGDLNVTYPDLEISVTDNKDTITAGSSQQYIVTVTNSGKSKIKGIDTSFTSPSDILISSIDSNRHIEELAPGENYTYEIEGSVSPIVLANTELKALVTVTSSEQEESNENNNGSDTTLVILPIIESDNKDARTPNLNVTVWNNVNDFVYPGDTVLAKITVTNQSPFLAREVKVGGSLSNDHPMPAIPMQWYLGNLKPGEKVEIEFSIGLIEELPEGTYHLLVEAKGKSESGDESRSGWVGSNFLLKLKYFVDQISPEVSAKEEVLGVSDIPRNKNFLVDNQKYLPYILATSILILIMISLLRKKIKKNEK